MAKEQMERLLAYTEWANASVLAAAALLDPADFRRDLRSSHGGVRGTLVHTMGAEWIWLERWKGLSPDRGPAESDFPDAASLQARWAALEEHRRDWLRSQRPDSDLTVISYRTFKGEPFAGPLWQLVQHVANHSTYHRGQVVAMLRQLGAKAPATDLVAWDRTRPEASA